MTRDEIMQKLYEESKDQQYMIEIAMPNVKPVEVKQEEKKD